MQYNTCSFADVKCDIKIISLTLWIDAQSALLYDNLCIYMIFREATNNHAGFHSVEYGAIICSIVPT
jgi:hypothetical protein